ncbi:MAG TPA: SRPBCC family protein [Candidatus Limnocylindrales bacterium]|nr:SRPBCC family protein [Candidatus Limnocylindrales bacterium]
MAVVTRAIRIEAPGEVVWDVLADIPGQPRWMRDLKSVRLTTPGPVGVGTRALGRVRMFGLTADDHIEIDAFEPGRHFGLIHRGRFAGRGDLRLREEGRATIVTWREELAPDLGRLGLPAALAASWRLVDPVFGLVLDVVFRSDLHRLRRLIESQQRAKG